MTEVEGGSVVPSEIARAEVRGESPSQPPAADMVHTVTKLDRAIKVRRDTDVPLINWWLYILLLSWVTFGIFGLYLLYRRVDRVDRFSDRKHAYYDAVLEWTDREADARGREPEIHHQVGDLKNEVATAYKGSLRPVNAGLSLVLTIVTLGLYGLYVLYRLNRYWWDAQVLEQDFDDGISQVWTTLGIVKYPINFQVDQSKRRSYGLYLILSFVTFGIWALVWDYKIHTDPDNLYRDFHGIEDTVLQVVRSH
jgi:hypothetical protein